MQLNCLTVINHKTVAAYSKIWNNFFPNTSWSFKSFRSNCNFNCQLFIVFKNALFHTALFLKRATALYCTKWVNFENVEFRWELETVVGNDDWKCWKLWIQMRVGDRKVGDDDRVGVLPLNGPGQRMASSTQLWKNMKYWEKHRKVAGK